MKSTEHPYYANESNYYTNDYPTEWETVDDFLDEFENADVDMNLVFRFDINKKTDDDGEIIKGQFDAWIYIIYQRKGIYAPNHINTITDSDMPRLNEYLRKHWTRMNDNWSPISE